MRKNTFLISQMKFVDKIFFVFFFSLVTLVFPGFLNKVYALTYGSSACGQTINLADGTYDELIVSANCSSSNPLTIRAQNDGRVIFDGEYSRVPVNIQSGSSYIVIEGLVARNSSSSVFIVYGNNITIRRSSAYNAINSDNEHIWVIGYNSDVLLEDCAGAGTGRNTFLVYDAERITFRRCWMRWDRHLGIPAPRQPIQVYGARDITFENCIFYNAYPIEGEAAYTDYAGVTVIHADYNRFVPRNIIFRGCLFHNNFHAGLISVDGEGNTQVIDSAIFDHPYLPCSGANWPCWERGFGVDMRTQNGKIIGSTFVNNDTGLRLLSSGNEIKNSIFLNNQIALAGSNTNHTYCDFWGNSNLGTSLVSSDQQVNPGFDLGRYGRGAYFFIPQSSSLKGAGQGGVDIGANILFQYENGVLTSKRLWPWPMESRIRAERDISVTWEANGGYWKTLDGVYDESPPTTLPGDLNSDNVVNILDLVIVGSNFGKDYNNVGTDKRADANGDRVINILDLVIVGSNFGRSS